MKVLKTKKANIAICWNGLRNVMPKDFPSIDEMNTTIKIIELFEKSVPAFVDILKEGEKLKLEFQSGDIGAEEIDERSNSFRKKAANLEQNTGNDIVEVEFEDADFNVFFQQVERWSKLWFPKVEPFLDFRRNMTTTNGQPKSK